MNANDTLRQHTCSDVMYRYLGNLVITEGVKALADNFQCYWFIDIVASYQAELKQEEFQVWKLSREEDTTVAKVVCTDGNDRVLAKQDIPYTDFKALEATVWVEFETVLLPSEH